MGEFIVRALFLATNCCWFLFFLSFNKVFESEVERELLLRRLYHLFGVPASFTSCIFGFFELAIRLRWGEKKVLLERSG